MSNQKKKYNTENQDAEVKDETMENTQNENNETSAETSDTETSLEETLQNEVNSLKDKYTRLFAEFDNYKKRTSKERVELIQTAGKEVIEKLLPILDDFDRALNAMENAQEVESIKEGVELIHNKFKNTLQSQGLKAMEDAKGQPFDADLQEAITTAPAPEDSLKDKIIDVIEKGYYLNDKVLRYAKVVIGK